MLYLKVKPVGYMNDVKGVYFTADSVSVCDSMEGMAYIDSSSTNSNRQYGRAGFPAEVVLAAISGAQHYIESLAEKPQNLALPMVLAPGMEPRTRRGHWVLDVTGEASDTITLACEPVEISEDSIRIGRSAVVKIKPLDARP